MTRDGLIKTKEQIKLVHTRITTEMFEKQLQPLHTCLIKLRGQTPNSSPEVKTEVH